MAGLFLSRRAEAELRQIWRYIGAENPAAADRLLLKVTHGSAGGITPFIEAALARRVHGGLPSVERPSGPLPVIRRIFAGKRDQGRAAACHA